MGKGDTRTRRGKIYNGSYGKKRPHRARKAAARRAGDPARQGPVARERLGDAGRPRLSSFVAPDARALSWPCLPGAAHQAGAALIALALLLAACSEELEWRETRLAHAAVLLPGRAQTVARAVPFEGQTLAVTMTSTGVGAAMFAIGEVAAAAAGRRRCGGAGARDRLLPRCAGAQYRRNRQRQRRLRRWCCRPGRRNVSCRANRCRRKGAPPTGVRPRLRPASSSSMIDSSSWWPWAATAASAPRRSIPSSLRFARCHRRRSMKLENPAVHATTLEHFWMPFTANRAFQGGPAAAGPRRGHVLLDAGRPRGARRHRRPVVRQCRPCAQADRRGGAEAGRDDGLRAAVQHGAPAGVRGGDHGRRNRPRWHAAGVLHQLRLRVGGHRDQDGARLPSCTRRAEPTHHHRPRARLSRRQRRRHDGRRDSRQPQGVPGDDGRRRPHPVDARSGAQRLLARAAGARRGVRRRARAPRRVPRSEQCGRGDHRADGRLRRRADPAAGLSREASPPSAASTACC